MRGTGTYGQIIILNNTDVTLVTYFESEGSTELIFGNGPDAHRPGLLADIREDEANWDNEDASAGDQDVLFDNDWIQDL
jgi:hypothetical protein